jgi:hypothetical protein
VRQAQVALKQHQPNCVVDCIRCLPQMLTDTAVVHCSLLLVNETLRAVRSAVAGLLLRCPSKSQQHLVLQQTTGAAHTTVH